MPTRDVLISGAGVAGPFLAHWLSRYGFRTTVVERAPGPRAGGQAVDFRGRPQLAVLERSGLLAEIRRRQTHAGDITIVDERGRRRSRLPARLFSGDVEILRGDLAGLLHEATRDHTEYVFGDRITALRQDGSGVHVAFAHAAPRTVDLVVGADGLSSGVRGLAFDNPPDTRHLGLYGAIFTLPNRWGLAHSGLMYSVPGRCATVTSHHDPGTAIASLDFASPPLPEDPRDTGQQRRLLADAFAGVGWHVPVLLDAADRADDFYFSAATQIRMTRWHTGRVALVGDAAHAAGPGGMGTGLAVVGAYVLAGELAKAGGDHETAFARYEQRLRPYVAACQKQAEGADRFLVPATWSRIRARDLSFRVLPYVVPKSTFRKLTTTVAEDVTLPDYPSDLGR